MTYKQAAQAALDCQDACNASGVLFTFAEAMKAICDAPENSGTEWKNRHPIVTLFLTKLSELNGLGFLSVEQPYYIALPKVKAIAERE